MKIWAAKQTWLSKNAFAKAETLDKNKITRIAVIKHAALGDLIQTRPFLIEIRKAFPKAKIILSVVSNYMKGIPDDLIDEIHIAKGNEKKYGFRESLKSYKDLGDQDILFDLTATSRSFWITFFTKATLKVGFKHKGLERLLYDVAIPRAHYRFEAETFLEQANVLGVRHQWPLDYAYPLPEKIIETNYISYFATASTAEKCWPPELMAELINKSCEQYPNTQHILIPGLADWELETAKIIEKRVGNKENFSMSESGPKAISLICHAQAVVLNDTGMRNLAIAADTPTVCIYPISSHVFGYTPLFGKHKAVVNGETEPAKVGDVLNALNEIAG